MSKTLAGGPVYTTGWWKSDKLWFSLGSHVTARNNSYGGITWSGVEPDGNAKITMSIFNADTDAYITGSLPLGSSPFTLSGLSTVSGIGLEVEFRARWLGGKPQLYWWNLDFLGTPLGDRTSAYTIQHSGT